MSQTNKADAAVWIRNSGSVTCEIPQLLSPFAKIPAALAAVFSVFLVGMPTLFFLLLYLLGPKEMIEDPGFAMAPLIFLGFMCFFSAASRNFHSALGQPDCVRKDRDTD